MKLAPRPRLPQAYLFFPLAIGAVWPLSSGAQLPPFPPPSAPMSSTYATRDGRIVSSVIGCAATDGSFTAQPCGVVGHPMHVQVDSGAGGTPTTAPGTASGQAVGVQGAGPGALPVAVSQAGVWTLTLPNGAHLALDAGGNVIGAVTQSGAWSVAVNNLPATQAVSAASLPLPTGAATAANQAIRNADGGAQVHVMNQPATQAVTGSVSVSNLPATQPVSGTVSVGNLPTTQAITASALPLPSGAATAANQPALNTDGGALVHLTNPTATQAVTGSVSVSNLPATQPVSGTVSVGNLPTTQAITASALPLPSGAATAANQPALNADGGALVHVANPAATQAVTGSVSVNNLPSTQAITAASLPLPSGAATAANQPALNADGGALMHLVNALPAGANTIGTVMEANRSAAWTDASFTATATATAPTTLAAAATRTGLHVWNVGSATVCLNYTAAATASAAGCAPGSVPIPAGSAYLEDQPGNVSPEAISLVCAGTSCPLTIKVR